MSKELYMGEVERIAADLEDKGYSPDEAYRIASERAYGAMRERLFDMADDLRKRAKGE